VAVVSCGSPSGVRTSAVLAGVTRVHPGLQASSLRRIIRPYSQCQGVSGGDTLTGAVQVQGSARGQPVWCVEVGSAGGLNGVAGNELVGPPGRHSWLAYQNFKHAS
jgi:hypothetical protein